MVRACGRFYVYRRLEGGRERRRNKTSADIQTDLHRQACTRRSSVVRTFTLPFFSWLTWTKRMRRQDFPTPESPTVTSLNLKEEEEAEALPPVFPAWSASDGLLPSLISRTFKKKSFELSLQDSYPLLSPIPPLGPSRQEEEQEDSCPCTPEVPLPVAGALLRSFC